MVPFKKHLTFLVLILGLFSGLTARPVDQETARAIAVRFMGTDNITLSSTYRTTNNDPAFYIFNTIDGFVIVAADDCETPIIGYSHEGRFNPDDVPVQMQEYLQDFVARIQYGIEIQIVADEITAKQWKLVKVTGRLNDNRSAKAVEPLLTTKWHQGCLYNSLCPEMSGPCGHAEVGCVAVAMGQIMNYWKFPKTGFGSHSYPYAGMTFSADFGNTEYDWDHAPDSLTETSSEAEIEATATLLYHCGVSVDMHYTANGSGAHSSDVPDALTRYFKYSDEMRRESMSDNPSEWPAKLKACLDSGRPVYYYGRGDGSHAFVCDGYDDNGLFHFNWGWGGNGDGFFALGNLNPLGHDYNTSNAAIFDIVPHYAPYEIAVTSNPPSGGDIVGSGSFLMGDSCILTAVPSDNCEFLYWKKDGLIVSYDTTYGFLVTTDLNLEANFSLKTPKQVTVNPASDPENPYVNLSWGNVGNSHWNLLKQFEIDPDYGDIATDGDFIYFTVRYAYPKPKMVKYSMNGEFVEDLVLEDFGFGEFFIEPSCLAYDGRYFYCNGYIMGSMMSTSLFCLDFDNKTLVDTIDVGVKTNEGSCTYDPINDGFWIGSLTERKLRLVDRNGVRIKESPSFSKYIVGAGYHTAEDETPHLLLVEASGELYDYDLTMNIIHQKPLTVFDQHPQGGFVGRYEGKDALYVPFDSIACIYEIADNLAQILHYRVYRSDGQEHITTLAEEVSCASYIDSTWKDLPVGTYRFGVSAVFANGNESEIVWSAPVEKTNHGIDENEEPFDPNVQKVFENGQIVIIKDGKKYTITGQEIK